MRFTPLEVYGWISCQVLSLTVEAIVMVVVRHYWDNDSFSDKTQLHVCPCKVEWSSLSRAWLRENSHVVIFSTPPPPLTTGTHLKACFNKGTKMDAALPTKLITSPWIERSLSVRRLGPHAVSAVVGWVADRARRLKRSDSLQERRKPIWENQSDRISSYCSTLLSFKNPLAPRWPCVLLCCCL